MAGSKVRGGTYLADYTTGADRCPAFSPGLHAEKDYRTTTEDFKLTRKYLRWRHLVGLARVTASEYGKGAAEYREACELLAKS